MTERKGIILAGGTGSRLWPITQGVSKQLLPIYDKPMIYYPLSVLMLSGIRDIAIITTPADREQFELLLNTGEQWGLKFTFIVQPSPDGLAQAYTLAEAFLSGHPSALILGDNIFFGHGLTEQLMEADTRKSGSTVFGYQVSDPKRYGVVGYDKNGVVESIEEKPEHPASNYAVTGLYFLDETASERAKTIEPSSRGELEITSLLDDYLTDGQLAVERLGRGYAWLDTGTHGSLLDASNYVRTLQKRQGLLVGSPDEISYKKGWISSEQLASRAALFGKSEYGIALERLLTEHQ